MRSRKAFTLIELPVVRKRACGSERSQRAFTLIELLIVIAIIGILAAVIFISLNSARKKAQDAQIKSDMTSLSQAIEVVKIDRTMGPVTAYTTLNDTATNDTNILRWLDGGGTAAAPVGNPIITKLPKSPIAKGAGTEPYYVKISASGNYGLLSKLNASVTAYDCIVNGNASTVDIVTWTAANGQAACPVN